MRKLAAIMCINIVDSVEIDLAAPSSPNPANSGASPAGA